ncbi:hypothetical protein L6R50_20020 [Myxococcota bacterium]|nr:hypothetical protein [Myxococcota bacterium]
MSRSTIVLAFARAAPAGDEEGRTAPAAATGGPDVVAIGGPPTPPQDADPAPGGRFAAPTGEWEARVRSTLRHLDPARAVVVAAGDLPPGAEEVCGGFPLLRPGDLPGVRARLAATLGVAPGDLEAPLAETPGGLLGAAILAHLVAGAEEVEWVPAGADPHPDPVPPGFGGVTFHAPADAVVGIGSPGGPFAPWRVYWDPDDAHRRAVRAALLAGRPAAAPSLTGGAGVLGRRLAERVPPDPGAWDPTSFLAAAALADGLPVGGLPGPDRPRSAPSRPWRRHRAEMASALRLRDQLRALFPGGLPEPLATFPGEYARDDLDARIADASRLLAFEGLATGDMTTYLEALENMALPRTHAPDADPLALLRAWREVTPRIPAVPLPLRAVLGRGA